MQAVCKGSLGGLQLQGGQNQHMLGHLGTTEHAAMQPDHGG